MKGVTARQIRLDRPPSIWRPWTHCSNVMSVGKKRKTNKHLPQRVYLKHGAYYFVDHQNKWRRLGVSLGEMYRALATFVETATIETVEDLCARYSREVLPAYSTKEQKTRAPHLVRIKAVFGAMRPQDVTPKHVRIFRDKIGERVGLEWQRPQLAKKVLMVLSHLFSVAAEWHLIETNPCKGVQRPPQPKRTRYPTDAEFGSVYRHCSPMLQVAMDLALLTGLRRGDILRLDRDCITDEGLLVKTSKTDKSLLFKWSDELRAVIDRALEIQPKVRRYIVCNRQGKPYTGDGFSTVWIRSREKALKDGGLASPFAFNDIRAKSATDDESLDRASQRLGHTSRQTTERFYIRKPRKVFPLR